MFGTTATDAMKATIEFQLPEDELSFRNASRADALCFQLHEFLMELRAWRKYGHKFVTADDALDAVANAMRDAAAIVESDH